MTGTSQVPVTSRTMNRNSSTDWLAARAYATPDALALIIGRHAWRYDELHQLVNSYAHHIRTLGIRPGHRVAVLLPNNLAYVCLVHALARLGAVLVPLNTRLTAPELQRQLAQSRCRLLLYGPETATLAEETAAAELPAVDVTTFPPAGPNEDHIHPFSLDNLQAIIYTSGTTGRPKGAMLTFANHFWSAVSSAFRLGVLPEDRWLSVLPLYHVGGLAVLFRSCLYGTAVVLHERFDLDTVNRSLDEDGVTLISLVPTMLYRLMQTRQSWPTSLRLVLLGGASAGPELLAEGLAAGLPVATTYGLTEAASQVATLLPAGVRSRPGSAGRPLLFTRLRIADDSGRSLPAGELGQILVSGPTVMAGYDGDPEATAQTLVNGELHTGDIGYLDEEGYLWVVQRRSDLIVSGGENVYPAEIEAVLQRHPAVAAACVVGLPHPEWGQQVAALVVPEPGREPTVEALAEHCREHLAGYKQPRHWRFTDALPQTASGKIARHAVREQFLSS